MKTAIIIACGIKQICLTPENEEERQALKMITADDDISLEIKEGSMYDQPPFSSVKNGYIIEKSQGGYLRGYTCSDSIMLVLTPKPRSDV